MSNRTSYGGYVWQVESHGYIEIILPGCPPLYVELTLEDLLEMTKALIDLEEQHE